LRNELKTERRRRRKYIRSEKELRKIRGKGFDLFKLIMLI
jgi:hypothetical protein